MALARHPIPAVLIDLSGQVSSMPLATLLMVIIFVLMVFFLIQINLAQRVAGQDDALKKFGAILRNWPIF